MLTITIPKRISQWDSKNEVFISTKEFTIVLEHSLVSISKWESKYHKPFLSEDPKTHDEMLYYILCMTITQNIDLEIIKTMTKENLEVISDYIDNKMTATWFNEKKTPKSKEIITSEVIYYWMIALQIPSEYQKWHLNRLLTLIKVCNAKSKSSNKKVDKKEVLSKNAELNAARRKQLGSSG